MAISCHLFWHDIQHGLLHFDKGIIFSIKELFTRPGHTIRDFIVGKRVKHFKPISLVVLLAGIYGFLYHYLQINILENTIHVTGSGEKVVQLQENVSKLGEWIFEHYSIIAFLQIPIFSIGTFLAFRKVGYNFIEHLVINAFLAAQRLTLQIITFPLHYNFNGTQILKSNFGIVDIVGYVIMAWTLSQLFNSLSRTQRVWRILLSFFIASLIHVLLFVIMGTLMFQYYS